MPVRIDANVSYLREMISEKCKVFARKGVDDIVLFGFIHRYVGDEKGTFLTLALYPPLGLS